MINVTIMNFSPLSKGTAMGFFPLSVGAVVVDVKDSRNVPRRRKTVKRSSPGVVNRGTGERERVCVYVGRWDGR